MLMILKELYKMKGVLPDGLTEESGSMVSSPATPLPPTPSYIPPMENIVPTPPVPLMSTQSIPQQQFVPEGILPPTLPPVGGGGIRSMNRPKHLSGRPVFDPFKTPTAAQMGMDPTVSPTEGKPLAPPPMVPANIKFNKPPRK